MTNNYTADEILAEAMRSAFQKLSFYMTAPEYADERAAASEAYKRFWKMVDQDGCAGVVADIIGHDIAERLNEMAGA